MVGVVTFVSGIILAKLPSPARLHTHYISLLHMALYIYIYIII